jgi:SAM-dependent methyltransferase/DNA-binding transcriptional ArsR family regulator
MFILVENPPQAFTRRDDMTVETVLDGLKAVAEPTRLRLLALCAASELTVSELTAIVGQSQPRVSRHLKVLCRAGLLTRYREQHWVYHRVPRQGTGADLVGGVLALLPPGDPRLALDRRRLEQVLGDRAAQARAALAARGGDGAARVQDEATVDGLIRDTLNGASIGELLDIGTGTGRILRLLGERAERAVGIDISRDMLLLARSNLHDAGLDHLMVRQGNMYQLRFDDASFDTVTIDQVLFQAEQPAEVLSEAARVLRPGGRLLLVEFLTERHPGPWAPLAEDVTAIDEERLDRWYAAAGLELAAARRHPGDPFPLIVHLAVRAGAGAETEAVA